MSAAVWIPWEARLLAKSRGRNRRELVSSMVAAKSPGVDPELLAAMVNGFIM